MTAYYHPFQGGVETHARELARHLVREGFELLILTKRVDRTSRAIETVDGIAVHRVPPAGDRSGLRKWLMIPFALIAAVRLRYRFDLIYCAGYQGIGLAAMASAAVLRRPVVLRSGNLGVLRGTNMDAPLLRWGIPPGGWLARRLKGTMRGIYLKANAFACVSREIEEEALACHIPRHKVHYLPNAVDTRRFRLPAPGEKTIVRSEEGWPQGKLLCLYVGRLSVEKGVLDLLEAWRLVAAPNRILILVGPDMPGGVMDAGPAARQYVSLHGMNDHVVFHGRSDDIPRLLRAADLYAQPSHYEAFSNSIIEAMATGLPIVATRVSGMLDCLVEGESALLCDPAAPADLARQLRRAMDDQPLRARLGAAARRTVVDRFSQAAVFNEFERLFAKTFADARGVMPAVPAGR